MGRTTGRRIRADVSGLVLAPLLPGLCFHNGRLHAAAHVTRAADLMSKVQVAVRVRPLNRRGMLHAKLAAHLVYSSNLSHRARNEQPQRRRDGGQPNEASRQARERRS